MPRASRKSQLLIALLGPLAGVAVFVAVTPDRDWAGVVFALAALWLTVAAGFAFRSRNAGTERSPSTSPRREASRASLWHGTLRPTILLLVVVEALAGLTAFLSGDPAVGRLCVSLAGLTAAAGVALRWVFR
jgi:hypothetical protein